MSRRCQSRMRYNCRLRRACKCGVRQMQAKPATRERATRRFDCKGVTGLGNNHPLNGLLGSNPLARGLPHRAPFIPCPLGPLQPQLPWLAARQISLHTHCAALLTLAAPALVVVRLHAPDLAWQRLAAAKSSKTPKCAVAFFAECASLRAAFGLSSFFCNFAHGSTCFNDTLGLPWCGLPCFTVVRQRSRSAAIPSPRLRDTYTYGDRCQ